MSDHEHKPGKLLYSNPKLNKHLYACECGENVKVGDGWPKDAEPLPHERETQPDVEAAK